MIDLKLSFQPGSDGKSLIVADQTVWPSDGVERSAAHLHLFVFRELGETVVEETFEPNANTSNVVSWTKAEAKDGYYKVILLSSLSYIPSNSYPKNSLVTYEGKLYRAAKDLVAGTSLTSENCWYEVTKLDQVLDMTSFPDSSYLIAHYLRDDDTNKCVGEKAIAYARKDCGCSDTCSQIEDYHWTTLYHAAAVYSFGFGDYSESGKLLGAALNRCGGAEKSPCNCH